MGKGSEAWGRGGTSCNRKIKKTLQDQRNSRTEGKKGTVIYAMGVGGKYLQKIRKVGVPERKKDCRGRKIF